MMAFNGVSYFTSGTVRMMLIPSEYSRNGGTNLSSVIRSFSILIEKRHDEDPPACRFQGPTRRYPLNLKLSVPPFKIHG